MKYGHSTTLLILFILFLSESCKTPIKVTKSQESETIRIKKQERLVIHLETNFNSGYLWSIEDTSFQFLKLINYKEGINNDSSDFNNYQEWEFKAIGKGSEIVHYNLNRPWYKNKVDSLTKKITKIILTQ